MVQLGKLSAALLAVLVATGAWSQAMQTKPTQAPAQAKVQTATQFYLEYRAAFDKAKKVEDLFPYMSAKNRKEAEGQPKTERDQMFELMKMINVLTNLKITKEDVTPAGTVLTATALDGDKKPNKGKITIVKESGAWKIGEESWSGGS
jgi:hypothetical protein